MAIYLQSRSDCGRHAQPTELDLIGDHCALAALSAAGTTPKEMYPKLSTQPQAKAPAVHLFPRRKAKELESEEPPAPPKRNRNPTTFSREIIEPYLHLPLAQAAPAMGLSVSSVKRICRRLGIERWPYQRPSSSPAKHGRSAKQVSDSCVGRPCVLHCSDCPRSSFEPSPLMMPPTLTPVPTTSMFPIQAPHRAAQRIIQDAVAEAERIVATARAQAKSLETTPGIDNAVVHAQRSLNDARISQKSVSHHVLSQQNTARHMGSVSADWLDRPATSAPMATQYQFTGQHAGFEQFMRLPNVCHTPQTWCPHKASLPNGCTVQLPDCGAPHTGTWSLHKHAEHSEGPDISLTASSEEQMFDSNYDEQQDAAVEDPHFSFASQESQDLWSDDAPHGRQEASFTTCAAEERDATDGSLSWMFPFEDGSIQMQDCVARV